MMRTFRHWIVTYLWTSLPYLLRRPDSEGLGSLSSPGKAGDDAMLEDDLPLYEAYDTGPFQIGAGSLKLGGGHDALQGAGSLNLGGADLLNDDIGLDLPDDELSLGS